MDRQERLARVEELERWVAESNEKFKDEDFPDEVRAAWDQYNRELDEHRRVLRELESRDARVRYVASQNGTTEPGASGDLPLSSRGGGGSVGPVIISRMTERDVYDLNSIRANPFQPEAVNQELRDRAMRAVELAHFPERASGLAGPTKREQAQAHVAYLLDNRDDEQRSIARRILLTGSSDYRRAFAKTLKAQLNRSYPTLSREEQQAMERVEEMRAMSVGTGSAGGFAVPYTLDPTVIPTSSLSVNPFRAICRVEQITVLQWLGVTSAGVTSSYGAEAAAATDNSPTLAQPSLSMVRANCFVPVSIELTQDWGALQSELANLIQDSKDDLEATQFAVGAGGATAPTGVVTGSTTTVTTATTLVLAVGDIYATEQALGPRFRPRAQWIANRFMFNKVRQFDTAGGANLLMYLPAGLANDVPRGGNMGQTLLGYPANECSGMAATLATTTKEMILGDPRYFIIVDRVGLDIEVIPHLFGAAQGNLPTGQRGFYAFWRNNSRVLDPNAFRLLVGL